nr:hypothetical protein MACL_00001595 [Theileria orientalis]
MGIKNKISNTKTLSSENDFEPCMWNSSLYSRSYFEKLKAKKFGYYDKFSILSFLFFHWVRKWVYTLSREFYEPYKFPPLPVSDQLMKLQPIFDKHVSDGILRLESYLVAKSQSKKTKAKKPYKSIFLRATVLTVGMRTLYVILILIIVNILTMSIAFLVKKIIELLNDETISLFKILFFILVVVVCQVFDTIIAQFCSFYLFRMISIIHYLISFSTYQHFLCYRRKYFNNVNGSNFLKVCNQVLHSCSPDSECSKNPLYCQARRYKNKEISPLMLSVETNDIYYISMAYESLNYIVNFLSDFIYGVILLSKQVKANLWILYVLVLSIVFFMVVFEIFNAYIFKVVLYIRDHNITKLNHIISHIDPIKRLLYDDIAINLIAQNRNFELSLFFIHMLLTFLNFTLYTSCMNLSFYIVKKYFVKSISQASNIAEIDTAGFMTTFYILTRINTSMFSVPTSIKLMGMAYVSLRRVDKFILDCSPNFYNSDNNYTGSTLASSLIAETTNQIPNNSVVYYKDATFTWVNTLKDSLNEKYLPYLKNINFELKRGEMAIVTGSQGSGKSNLIKSILGDMTLIGGSMAVVPLYTSMPIFYASQNIWLLKGTIRSNIVFGYKFDEHIYETVIRAVELEHDISTWENGDLRVVADNAHSLSGGQRVRMEMARAIYAYLIFHKVNKQYNNSKCSFLMCLDASFHGLDPYVSKTIFNNLFNSKTGLLVKNDLSVVLTASKQTLEIWPSLSELSQIRNVPIYNIKNQTLTFYSNLHDIVKKDNSDNKDNIRLSTSSETYYINYLTDDMLNLCSSDATTRVGRMEVTGLLYSQSFKKYIDEELGGVKLSPLKIYLSPAIWLFTIFMSLSIGFNVLDNTKYVLTTTLSDFINKQINQYNKGQIVDLSEIKTRKSYDHLNYVHERAITGSQIYRSFKKYFELIKNGIEHRDYRARRAIEYKANNTKFYGVRRLFHHPKISIVDAGRYMTPEHTGVELIDPESMILKHVSVSAHRSEIIGMIGKTGAGKTTLLSVLQNTAENRTGQVLLDSSDLNDIPKAVLRQVIDPRRLFSDDEINDALKRCGLLEFINNLPGGKKLDTVIVGVKKALGVEFLLEYILTNIESKVRYKLNKNSRYTGNILVTPTLKENYKFYIYKHTPFLGHEKKNCEIWYNTHKIIVYSDDVESDKLSNVENLIYNKIETYSLVISSDFHLLIKFTSTSGKAYYLQRVDTSGKYWNQILISDYELKDDKLFRSKLDEFSYVLKKSIMVHIDEEPGHYEMYLVDNTDRIGYEGFYQEKTHESQIIEVVNEKNCSLFKQSHFTMHTHNLSQSKNSAELERIGGLRLFVTGNQKDQSILVYKEVKIYKNVDTNESNRIFLTYTPGPGRPFQETNNDNVYVFFHDEDPRPLMLSYNDKAYRARNEKEEGSPKYPPTTISERDPHSTISVTTELKPHSQPPPQQPLPPVHPPPPSGHIPPPSKEEKTKQKPHVLVQKPEVTKSTHDHGRPKGYHTDTRDSESKVSSSSPKSTVQVDQRHSVTAQRRDDHIQTSESPRGTTNLMEELTPPAPRPPSSPKLPESTPMNPPSQGSDRTTKVPEPSLRASGSPHSKGTEGQSRSITHSKPSKVTQPDLPRAEARQATHDSTANDTSDTKTTIIASSTTAGVVVAGGATGTLVYLKFPYIFYPAIKALL